jgi:hypothetical protein
MGTETEDLKPDAGQRVNSDIFKTPGLLIIPLILILIAVQSLLNTEAVFEPPLLLAVMNTPFLEIITV